MSGTHPYIPGTAADEAAMLEAIGVRRFEDLLLSLPEKLRLKGHLDIHPGRSEWEVVRDISALGNQNAGAGRYTCFLGGGIYDHHIPSVIDHVTMRSEFYTAYTPYQAEVSQGTLIAIYEFQTMISELTGLPVANASLYDGASAAGEAALLAASVTGRSKTIIAGRFHPHYRDTLKTYVEMSGHQVVVDPAPDHVADLDWLKANLDDSTAAVFVQHPNFFGQLEAMDEIRELTQAKGGLFVAVVDPSTLGILAPPGAYGADIAVGECQPLGIPMAYGGPVAGFFAANQKYLRQMPGRLVGETVDRDGKRCWTLTLQTREQHIRREKATSNICTNQTLLAHRATVYMSLLGPAGIRELGEQCHARASHAARTIAAIPGYSIPLSGAHVKEFVVQCPVPAADVVRCGLEHQILAGLDLGRFDSAWKDLLLVAVTEKRSAADILKLSEVLAAAAASSVGSGGPRG
ncbi:MAG: aminomethyl-transferring glycine dehydrogenase subunit GcvPA [Candidatus Eisenbacteria bacterium]|nr:aminomethyl-transferring glycine dehydrogenase subunit GcvPA [Candidatus Eisenbacteria bacterium]